MVYDSIQSLKVTENCYTRHVTFERRWISTPRTPLLSKLRFSNSIRKSITLKSFSKRFFSDIAQCYFKIVSINNSQFLVPYQIPKGKNNQENIHAKMAS